GQHHGHAGRQPSGQLYPDLTAPAENHDESGIRVLHECDYHLR
ncbi:MAG: hypothetical protein QOD39_2072, partial [Mycobacterium sp.]|nr:hypothetical protein [Mycobacterium sp.]